MAAYVKAPWGLRIYAALIVGTALVAAIAVGGERSWIQVCWAGVFSVLVCTGNRFFWWFVVVLNILVLIAAPFFFAQWWISMALSAAGLACLLAPDSRRYVFERAD